MKLIEARLECLKLAHTHGRDTPQVLERADAYVSFVMNGKATVPQEPQADNTDE